MLSLLFAIPIFAATCAKWNIATEIGLLPHKEISESSGLQISKKIKDRIYHVNDSGDGPFFYITNYQGKNLKTIKVENFYPVDVEELTIASYDNTDYIVIADTGDNLHIRDSVALYFIEEKESYPDKVFPSHIMNIKYPKGEKKNVEALAYHPSGDIYIFSKEENIRAAKAFPLSIFKIKKEAFSLRQKEVVAEFVGMLDLPSLQPNENWLGQIATGLDIDEGGNWLLLTYKRAIYSTLDLTKSLPKATSWKLGRDYMAIDLLDYPQQEAISFIPTKSAFVFSTEYKKKYQKAPLARVDCALSLKQ